MAYESGDIASQRFLGANVIYQATNALLKGDDEADRGVLDDAVLLMDVVSSYDTEHDEAYAVEFKAIQDARQRAQAGLRPGMELDPSVLEGFRWRELKAMFRSMCRQGAFKRQDSPMTEWIPKVR